MVTSQTAHASLWNPPPEKGERVKVSELRREASQLPARPSTLPPSQRDGRVVECQCVSLGGDV